MTEFVKIAGIAMLGTLLSLTLRKTNGEIAFLVSVGTGIVVIASAWGLLKTVYDAVTATLARFAVSDVILEPLLKCAAISVTAKIAAELCRQSGEGALAMKVELAGTLSGIVSTLPLLQHVFSTIAGLLVIIP